MYIRFSQKRRWTREYILYIKILKYYYIEKMTDIWKQKIVDIKSFIILKEFYLL